MKRNTNISIEEEKKLINQSWNEYIAKLTLENYSREEMILNMQRINTIDYRLIKQKRNDLLG